jgi:hypothetical protein
MAALILRMKYQRANWFRCVREISIVQLFGMT